MIQAHYIYCALYVYYYFTSSTSDHQTSEPGGPPLREGKAQSRTRGCPVPSLIFPHLSFWDPRRKDVNSENILRGLSALPDMSLTKDVVYLYANVMYICKCVLNGSLRGVGGQCHLSWGLWRRQIFMLIMRYLTPGDGDGQGGLACCDSWGVARSQTQLSNWTELNLF